MHASAQPFQKELSVFTQGLSQIFPREVDALVTLCTNNSGYPLGFAHPDSFLELVGFELEEKLLLKLRTGYVCLSGYYFLLDAIIDEHLTDSPKALYLSHLLSATHLLFYEVCREINPSCQPRLSEIICSYISDNAEAVQAELRFQASPLVPAEVDEYMSIVGRSNSALLLYETLCAVSGRAIDITILGLLNDLVYYLQLIDDLGDWREDYCSKRWTSLLRTCFSRHKRILDEAEVEEEIYLSGISERRLATAINGLTRVQNGFISLQGVSSTRLQLLIDTQTKKARASLEERVQLKLDVLVGQ